MQSAVQVWNSACLGMHRPLCNGQVKISEPPPEASGRAGCGAQRELEPELGPSASRGRKGTPGQGDWVSGVGHRREQGVGAASHEAVWAAGQERPGRNGPCPPAGKFGYLRSKTPVQAPF